MSVKTIIGIASGAVAGIFLTVALVGTDAATKSVTYTLPTATAAACKGLHAFYELCATRTPTPDGGEGACVPGVRVSATFCATTPTGREECRDVAKVMAITDARLTSLYSELVAEWGAKW